jgi:hypothetical protein
MKVTTTGVTGMAGRSVLTQCVENDRVQAILINRKNRERI